MVNGIERKLEMLGLTPDDEKRLSKLSMHIGNAIDKAIEDMREDFKKFPEIREIPEEYRDKILSETPREMMLAISTGKLDENVLKKLNEYANLFASIPIPLEWQYSFVPYVFKTLINIALDTKTIESDEIPEFVISLNKALTFIFGLFGDVYIEKEYKEKIETQHLLKQLSTPILHAWQSIIVMPLIGEMTSDRAMDAMEKLLEGITKYHAKIAIIDITGVPMVDTMVADSLIKTIKAVKILGSEAVLTGISPEVAATFVKLGVEVEKLITRNTLQEGLKYGIKLVESD